MTLTQKLSEVRARLEAATPGPWRIDEPKWNGAYGAHGCTLRAMNKPSESEFSKPTRIATLYLNDIDSRPYDGVHEGIDIKANAEFIANAPADLALLHAICEIQAKALEQYKLHGGVTAHNAQAEIAKLLEAK